MSKQLMLGNAALARGLYEAGCAVASSYPGTPSTETTEEAAKFDEIYCEWAPNEKVAMEVAFGASMGGKRSFCAMKHVGLNVAADPLFTISYTGINAGMVICVADDAGMHSSQNEQDSRHYAIAAKVPMLEPADSAEALEFTKLAFELSEQFDTPVFIKMCTRVSHSQSIVETHERIVPPEKPYIKNIQKNVMMPGNAKKKHPLVEARTRAIAEYAETCRIGLIPSLFWHFAAVPRYFGETYRSWGRDTSRTLEFMKTYTRRVVETLQGCKSIFAWEFGNEFNLEADLPNWQEIYKTDDPDNCLTADDVQYAYETFVQTVRAVDSTGRLICSGNAALRPSQYHQYVEHSWTADTPQQYAEITRKLNPDGMCSVSEHIYDRERKVGPYDSLLDLDGQLALARDAAHSMGKIYYVGEFAGVLPSEADYRIFYDAFPRAGVPLSLVWNFSMKGNIEYSFTAESDRGKYIFALIREYNEKLNAVQ